MTTEIDRLIERLREEVQFATGAHQIDGELIEEAADQLELLKPMLAERENHWRCFHCGDVFTSEACAKAHFGPDEMSKAACVIKAGAEGSLVRALREAEQEAADAWAAIHNEGTEAAQAYYRQTGRHQQQLQAAEEAGYERGLADGHTQTGEQQ